MKIYKHFGITDKQIEDMEAWLHPKLADKRNNSISALMEQVKEKYKDHRELCDYTLYYMGYLIGVANELHERGENLVLHVKS